MKKHLLFLSFFLSTLFGVFGQNYPTIYQNWNDVEALRGYHVEFQGVDWTCYDNGEVKFRIVDDSGNPVTIADFGVLRLDTLIRISRKAMGANQLDTSWHHTDIPGGYEYGAEWMSVHLDDGLFRVRFQCIYMPDPNDITQNISVITDTVIEIKNTYIEPSIYAVNNPSYTGVKEGNIPTLNCSPTGLLQVKIDGGKFPYTVIVDSAGVPKDTVVFDEPMPGHDLSDSAYAKYIKYFDFPNLGAGEWNFTLTDACGTTPLPTGQFLTSISMPKIDHLQIYAFSGDIHHENIFKINAILNTNYTYYIEKFAPYMEYCFTIPMVPGRDGNRDLQECNWRPFPTNGSNKVTLADTVENFSFCSMLERDIEFHFRIREDESFADEFPGCHGYDTTIIIRLEKPTDFLPTNGEELDNTLYTTDPCLSSTIYKHQDHFSIKYNTFNRNYIADNQENTKYTYHFTYPLVWEYWDEDANGSFIKSDTIWEDFSTESSTLSLSDFQMLPLYHNPQPGFSRTVRRTLRELNAPLSSQCFLYDNSKVVKFDSIVNESNGPEWDAVVTQPTCFGSRREIRVYEKYPVEGMDNDGLTIKLVKSPDYDYYNFTAVYHSTTQSWTITPTHPANLFPQVIQDSYGHELKLSAINLPSGYYAFEVSHAVCGADRNIEVYLGGIDSVGLTENPDFEVREGCNEKYVKFTKGTVSQVNTYIDQRSNPNHLNGDQYKLSRITELRTRFKVIGGPVGGYDYESSQVYKKGDSIRLSFPTTPETPYKVLIYTEDHPCNVHFTDTFDLFFEGKSLTFDYASALLCDRTDTMGTAYVKAKAGVPPYIFTLYPRPDLEGEPLGCDTIYHQDSIAVFKNKLFNADSYLSCKVVDACGQKFQMNFPPYVTAELQMAWFSPNVSHTCEGDSVQIFALQIGMIFNYLWTDPAGNAFYDGPDPIIFIPRGCDTGTYTVTILQEGCQNEFYSSVKLYPEPSPLVDLKIVSDSVVCPGDPVTLVFTPQVSDVNAPGASTARVSFKMAFEDLYGITYREFNNKKPGDPITVIYEPVTYTKIYPVHIEETLGECTYDRADPGDTLRIHISDNRIDPCMIITRNALVCSGTDTALYASCNDDGLFTIRWYNDYELTQLVQEDHNMTTNQWSRLALPNLTDRQIRYVSVAKSGMCPSSNNSPNGVRLMENGKVDSLRCTDELLFYDAGGRDGDYRGVSGHEGYTHMFVCPGHTVSVHLESLNLSESSHLAFYNGSRLLFDSLIYSHNVGEDFPTIITSNSDTLMVYFAPGELGGEGWQAIVKPSPGVAIGDVIPTVQERHTDVVCQSQVNTYNNADILGLDIATQEQLNQAIKVAGTYPFTKETISQVTHCDSLATLSLKVTPAPRKDFLGVTTNLTGYLWHDSLYKTAGMHIFKVEDEHNCDSYEVLNLIVIEVSNPDQDFCESNDSLVLGVTVLTHDSVVSSSSLIQNWAIGDVLCVDKTGRQFPVRVDSLATHPDYTPIGVVFYLSSDNMSGKAVALRDASINGVQTLQWASGNSVHSATNVGGNSLNSYYMSRADMGGMANTLKIRNTASGFDPNTSSAMTAQQIENFKKNAQAAYACYYYDPEEENGEGKSHQNWYLPSSGEWNLYYAFRANVNETLSRLASYGATVPMSFGSKPDDAGYWTSTESGNATAVHINSKGQIHAGHNKNRSDKHVRPVIEF